MGPSTSDVYIPQPANIHPSYISPSSPIFEERSDSDHRDFDLNFEDSAWDVEDLDRPREEIHYTEEEIQKRKGEARRLKAEARKQDEAALRQAVEANRKIEEAMRKEEEARPKEEEIRRKEEEMKSFEHRDEPRRKVAQSREKELGANRRAEELERHQDAQRREIVLRRREELARQGEAMERATERRLAEERWEAEGAQRCLAEAEQERLQSETSNPYPGAKSSTSFWRRGYEWLRWQSRGIAKSHPSPSSIKDGQTQDSVQKQTKVPLSAQPEVVHRGGATMAHFGGDGNLTVQAITPESGSSGYLSLLDHVQS